MACHAPTYKLQGFQAIIYSSLQLLWLTNSYVCFLTFQEIGVLFVGEWEMSRYYIDTPIRLFEVDDWKFSIFKLKTFSKMSSY